MALPVSPAELNAMRRTRITKTLAQLAICVAAMTAVAAVLYTLPVRDRPLSPALAFLFVVLIVSSVWGFGYAVFASFLAALGFLWLLPPVGQFWVDDPRDWLALAAFLVIGIVTSHLSERARRESLARRREKELRDVIETMPAMAWTTLPDGANIFQNKGWTEYTGLSVEESQGHGWQTATHPEDLKQYLEKWRASLASGHPFESEVRVRRASDGEYRWFLARALPLRDERGNIRKWYGMLTDLEDRKRAEQALREGDAKIRRLVDANIIGVWFGDLEGRIMEANDAFLHMVGYEREDLISGRMRLLDMTPPEWRARTAQRMVDVALGGTVQAYEKEYFRKDGSRVPVLVGSTFFGDANQGVAFVVDLTERKRAEAERRESERQHREVQMELAHANRVATMGQLTASIVHEVKQPIAAMVINAQAGARFLDVQMDRNKVRQILTEIEKDGNRASEVISRIHHLFKKAPPRRDRWEINGAISEVIEITHGEAVKNGISVRTELADGLPLVQGDRVQLQQVSLNLIINAIQAMSGLTEGTRELHVGTENAGQDGVRVAVRDSGPGLSAESLQRLFEPFYTTKPNGMGMGLSICRSIIEDHGGRLWATGLHPHGALFQFTIPAR